MCHLYISVELMRRVIRSPPGDIIKTGLLKIGRIWLNHVTQVWPISYSAVCKSSSCYEQQVAIFFLSRVRLSCSFVCSVCLDLLQENLVYVLILQQVEKFTNMEYPDASLDDRLCAFLLEAIGLFVDEAELFFLFQTTTCHFPS